MLLLMGAGWRAAICQHRASAAIHHPDGESCSSSRDQGKLGNCFVPALVFIQSWENKHCCIPELGRTFLLVPVSSSPLFQPPFLPQNLSLNQTCHC